MVRRSLGAMLWILVGVLAGFLGSLSALVGTNAGRALLTRVARTTLEGAVAGQVELGGVSGTLLTSLALTNVRLYDRDTTLVAWLPRAELDYNLLDFAAGRVVFQGVRLDRPYVNLVQHRNGRLNLEELLRLGEPSPPRTGPKPLVALLNVRIEDADLVLRLQAPPSPSDSLYEIDPFGPDGRHRVRRFRHLTSRLDALHLSAPGQRGIGVDLAALAVRASDPAVSLVDVQGHVTIEGDSLDADLPLVQLPASRFSLVGHLAWPRGPLLYGLAIAADSVTLTDARFIDPKFPAGAVLRGTLAVRSHGARLLEVGLDSLNLAYRGGKAAGRATLMIASDSGLIAVRRVDLTAQDLDLALPRAFLDTLPFYGHLTGRTVADGPLAALAVDVDWRFRDSLAAGYPENLARGRGQVNLLDPEGLAFTGFAVDTAALDFGTIARLVPPATLHGSLDAAGTLDGPLADVRFEGRLRHHNGTRPASALQGRFAVDSRADTVALDVDARVDTLSFDGLAGPRSGSGLTGIVTGSARLAGRLDSLVTHLDLTRIGGGGRLRLDGALVLLPDQTGGHGLGLDVRELSLDRWIVGAPPSSLNLSASLTLGADSGDAAPQGEALLHLRSSRLAGIDLDSGVVRARFTRGLVHLDTVWLRQPGLITEGAGAIGWRRPARGEAFLNFLADSLGRLDSLVAWFAGTWRDSLRSVLEDGAGVAHLRVAGALDSLAVGGWGEVDRIAFGGWRVPVAQWRGQVEPGPVSLVRFDVTADSIARGSLGFGAAAGAIQGRADSLEWRARSRIGDLGGVAAFGRFTRGSGSGGSAGAGVFVDSLGVAIPGGVWALEAPATIMLRDSAVTVDRLVLQRVNGPGHLLVEGSVSSHGTAKARLHVDGLPLAGVYALLQRDTASGGTVTADLEMSGSRFAPEMTGSFLVAPPPDHPTAPTFEGRAAYGARRFDGDARLRVGAREVLSLTAHLPLDLALTPVPRRLVQDTLAVGARADRADLAVLEALAWGVRDVRGRLTADVGIRGTWSRPELRGDLRIDSAAVSLPALNVHWQDIVGRFRLGGDTIHVDTLGIGSDRGRADVTGTVRLERLTHPVLALDILARDFQALEIRGDLSVTASAALTLRGPVFGATLAGSGTVTNGVLYFADLVEKRIIDLDAPDPALAALIDTSLAAVISRQGLGPAFHNLFLDSLAIQGLQLNMGSSVWLRSNEANIQLAGRVTVNKANRNYLLTGTLQAPRGTYRLKVGPVTREFVVTQGTVRYFGTPDLDAALDIEAQHLVRPVPTPTPSNSPEPGKDVTVIAHIGGTLYVPRLTLSVRDREMPQSDIISYLMFGQPSADIGSGALGGAANRSAILSSTVSSIISGAISGELERTAVADLGIPLDYVEIRPGDPGNPLLGASFAAGWQIGTKTFLILRASVCPGAVTNVLGASLQFRISPEWRTEASMEPVGGCTVSGNRLQTGVPLHQIGVDLFWERRY